MNTDSDKILELIKGKRLCCSENCFELGFQLWQVFGDRGPNNIQINIEVGMDQTITHSTDILPGNGAVLGSDFGRYLAGRFTNNLKLFDQG
jgi:hypothetical protein